MGRKHSFLFLGGVRSGKSRMAQALAEYFVTNQGSQPGEKKKRGLYIATAQPLDPEMKKRITAHRLVRSKELWLTMEEPLRPWECLEPDVSERFSVVLLDCITLWLTNIMLKSGSSGVGEIERLVGKDIEQLLFSMEKSALPVILVSNEVGMGIVPESRLGREFRDLSGFVNQRLAAWSSTVVFAVAGLPMIFKGSLPEDFSVHSVSISGIRGG